MSRSHVDALRWVRAGNTLARDAMAGLTEEALVAASGLPGWSRKHLVAHLAANADALGNLVRWAATGVPSPMYASPGQRAADIEAGARRPGEELVEWFDRSAAALDAAIDALTDDQWHAEVVTAQGRAVPATDIPWLRAREVMVHAVDLRTGLAFADLPADFLVSLVYDIVAKRSAAANGPALMVAPTDDGSRWVVDGTGPTTTVTGTLACLTAYLAGRSADGVSVAGENPVPQLPAWL